MEEILEYTERLSQVLVDSGVYQNYLYAKNNLSCDDMKLLTEFKKLRLDYLNNDKDFAREKNLSSIYSKLMLVEGTRQFLQKELEMTRCLKEIYSVLVKDLDMELFL